MSDIHGEGYGSTHDWRHRHTSPDKRSAYQCAGCAEVFYHWYDRQPNIFTAMKEAGVPEVCEFHRDGGE